VPAENHGHPAGVDSRPTIHLSSAAMLLTKSFHGLKWTLTGFQINCVNFANNNCGTLPEISSFSWKVLPTYATNACWTLKRNGRPVNLYLNPLSVTMSQPADTAAAHHTGVSPVPAENHGHPAYRWGGSPTCENRKKSVSEVKLLTPCLPQT